MQYKYKFKTSNSSNIEVLAILNFIVKISLFLDYLVFLKLLS